MGERALPCVQKEGGMKLPRWLVTALRLPCFLAAVLLLYWAVVVSVLVGRINLLRRRQRNDMYHA